MSDVKDGGPAFPDERDKLAIEIMKMRLAHDFSSFRDPKFIAYHSYALVDAMLAARGTP